MFALGASLVTCLGLIYLFICEIFLNFNIIAFLFLFDKYYPIIE